jgi:hypothetical protein
LYMLIGFIKNIFYKKITFLFLRYIKNAYISILKKIKKAYVINATRFLLFIHH